MEPETQKHLQLPVSVVDKVAVGRLLREIDNIDEFLRQAAVRQPGTPLALPKTSKLMEELLNSNGLNALVDADRQRVTNYLKTIRDRAPVIHMSFSADPSPLFTQKMVTYLRQNIHPVMLLQVGLQPAIGAGTVVRTTNKYFDFSLRDHFKKTQSLLLEKLRGMPDTAQATEVPATAQQPQTAAAATPSAATAPPAARATVEPPQAVAAPAPPQQPGGQA